MHFSLCISAYAFQSMHYILCISFHPFYSMHFILCISLFSFHYMHFMLYILFYEFYSRKFILCISFSTLHFISALSQCIPLNGFYLQLTCYVLILFYFSLSTISILSIICIMHNNKKHCVFYA